MNTGSFGYLFKQGIHNVWLNRVMSLASVGILTACLIILGGAGLLSANLRDMFLAIETQNEVVIYVKDDATDEQVKALGDSIRAIDHVDTVTFVSKAQALADQKEQMGDKGYLLDRFDDDNPLPASYRVTLDDLNYLSDVQTAAGKLDGVDTVTAPTHIAETLTGIERTMIVLGSIIIGILLVASVVVISNTIRLTVFSRRREISIMKYVGATNGFIKFPFEVEGMAIGLISALLAFGVLTLVYLSLSNMLAESTVLWVKSMADSLIPYGRVWYKMLIGFLVGGIYIGVYGSANAMRKYLRV